MENRQLSWTEEIQMIYVDTPHSTSDKSKLKNILKIPDRLLLKTVTVSKNKELS